MYNHYIIKIVLKGYLYFLFYFFFVFLLLLCFIFFFFFSSRRRHTRFDCDWSSDVCSSDLGEPIMTKESSLTILQLKQLLVGLQEHGHGICIRVRLLGEMWQDHFMKVIRDRKSTRLNSSHSQISYAVFCLKKKKKKKTKKNKKYQSTKKKRKKKQYNQIK